VAHVEDSVGAGARGRLRGVLAVTPFERHGARELLAKVEPAVKTHTAARKYWVYVVYLSQGDELLAVEVGPLALGPAEDLLGRHRRTSVWSNEKRNYVPAPPHSGAVGAYLIERPVKYGSEKHKGDTDLAARARLVTLPSQVLTASVEGF
jgi:hypothetical protein